MAEQSQNKEMEELKAELDALKEEIQLLAGSLKEAGIDQAKATYWRARVKGDEAASALSEKVEERPLTSIFSAFGIGMVVGLMLNRRNQ